MPSKGLLLVAVDQNSPVAVSSLRFPGEAQMFQVQLLACTMCAKLQTRRTNCKAMMFQPFGIMSTRMRPSNIGFARQDISKQ